MRLGIFQRISCWRLKERMARGMIRSFWQAGHWLEDRYRIDTGSIEEQKPKERVYLTNRQNEFGKSPYLHSKDLKPVSQDKKI